MSEQAEWTLQPVGIAADEGDPVAVTAEGTDPYPGYSELGVFKDGAELVADDYDPETGTWSKTDGTFWRFTESGEYPDQTFTVEFGMDAYSDADHAGEYYFVFAGLGDPITSAVFTLGIGAEEIEWYSRTCRPAGARRDVDETLATDFGPALFIDLANGSVWPGKDMPFPCAMSVSGPCAEEGETPSRMLFGGADGYVYRVSDDYAGRGAPLSKLAWTVSAYDAGMKTIAIDPVAEATDYAPDGMYFPTGFLAGLEVEIVQAGAVEAPIAIASNTATRIVLDEAPATAPVAGDTFYIGRREWGILFPEIRTEYPSSLRSVRCDLRDEGVEPQKMTIEVYKEASGARTVDLSATAATLETDSGSFSRGRGECFVPAVSGVARTMALKGKPVGGGAFTLAGLQLSETVSPAERGRQ